MCFCFGRTSCYLHLGAAVFLEEQEHSRAHGARLLFAGRGPAVCAYFSHLKNKAVLQPCSRAIRPQALSNRAPRNSSRIVLQRPHFILTNQRSTVPTMSSWSASTG